MKFLQPNQPVIIHSLGDKKEYRGMVVGSAVRHSEPTATSDDPANVYIIELIDKIQGEGEVWKCKPIVRACIREVTEKEHTALFKKVESIYDISFEELVDKIAANTMSQLLIEGGKGVRSSIYNGIMWYVNWKNANGIK